MISIVLYEISKRTALGAGLAGAGALAMGYAAPDVSEHWDKAKGHIDVSNEERTKANRKLVLGKKIERTGELPSKGRGGVANVIKNVATGKGIPEKEAKEVTSARHAKASGSGKSSTPSVIAQSYKDRSKEHGEKSKEALKSAQPHLKNFGSAARKFMAGAAGGTAGLIYASRRPKQVTPPGVR